jgi:CHAD domain-containing protein
MAFRFEQKESGSDGIKRVARERVSRVLKNLSQKPGPNARNIHSARKDLKSLRALLRLVQKAVKPEEWRQDNLIFRDSGRTLSRSRDAQVMMETLNELLNASHNARPSRFSQSAQKIKKELEQDAKLKIAGPTLQEALKLLRTIQKRSPKWFTPPPDANKSAWTTLLGDGFRRSYGRGRKLLKQCEFLGPENFAEESWHQLRKHAKTLGYQLRLIRPIWSGPLKCLIDELDELTDALGKNHDLVVLHSRIADEPYSEVATQRAADERVDLLRVIEHRQARLKMSALDIARRVYIEKPRQFEKRLRAYWEIWHRPAKEKISGDGEKAMREIANS